MASRFAVSLFTAAFVVSLFVPATVAAVDGSISDASTTVGGGAEAVALDRLRPAVTSPSSARGSGRSTVATTDPASRDDTHDALEQPTRADVYRAIWRAPGKTLSGLADAVGVTKSTVRYHARVLDDAGLVASTEASGALRYAPVEDDVELAAALNADGTGAVLDAVARHEPASVTTLAEATDRARSTVSHHLSALEERGIVERERSGEAVVTTLAPATKTALSGGAEASADD